jgi:hypothetical protein
MRRMFERFDRHYAEFDDVNKAMCTLDALMSLAVWSTSADVMCR